MLSNIKVGLWHCRRIFMIAGCLAVAGYLVSPDSATGRFWVASLWMFLSPVSLVGRHSKSQELAMAKFSLHASGRTKIWFIEVLICTGLTLLVGVSVCKGFTLAALAMGVWGAFLCAVASVLEQIGRRSTGVLSIVMCIALLFWASPFWLGSWLGEPGFTPWLASWVMCLHPVSQALTFSGASNLIEPVFYSLTFIGVVEVELFSPFLGLLLASGVTIGIFGYSFFLNRRRSVLSAAPFNQMHGV